MTRNPPRRLADALWRGARGHCPRCDGARLFAAWLRPVAQCPACAQDWRGHSADDFPPYVAILITGHVMAPVIIALGLHTTLSWPVMMGVCLTMTVTMVLGLLQPAKGAVIALQWWLGLHGFAAAPGKALAPGAASTRESAAIETRPRNET
ncbi:MULTISPECIES: DUF983 domain-containing protein [unclassified Novosphingobium]|uniref:DUF983 domain-containing protein n=1 Tax=unclassified Novosphingobium TaxID=2644732 RepID=UPI00144168A0|nr:MULTISPECIES: DUF983 domain-containing protein [unclassified Novosphingobium]MBB3359383.1 uncharacterized protein (DUF983 family) [Novosphingobium sp. BK256]MBB3375743.1 uncharacterized protein (DUF983 family) [Novosphingobium sp. BK280]MBB3380156.1 uncharacterized protein (DUF983 family) [Novosphingobium sp. BK258]MBB3421850.1 uncharacterized protein (DUF983 family) [Novosphingobium sp. BK267]MBB3450506.1 uncharacterized protein (DUF983 family) [Novosphingobium sp. BK352]